LFVCDDKRVNTLKEKDGTEGEQGQADKRGLGVPEVQHEIR